MKLNNRKIAVIGAGVAGLATARALALRGARPIVVEQARDLGQIGAGLQITPNGMAVLEALGLGRRVRDAALSLDDVSLHDHRAGSRVLRLRLDKSASTGNWLAIQRAELIKIMREGVERVGAEVRTNTRVVQIETRPQKTILNFADGRSLEAAVVIAADGLHSIARQSLGGGATPFFTKQVAWRAVIDDDANAPPVAQVFMAPGRHLVSYPLPSGKRNIVAVEEREDWAEESWTATGDPDQLRAAFARFGGAVPVWLEQVKSIHLWGLFRHEVPARWHGGSLVLVGDAAHPTLPFLAQGANLALEDAWVLADTLADAPGVSAALTTFQERRVDRVKRSIRAANANARNYHLRNPLMRFAAHNGLRMAGLFSPRAALGKFDWLYRHDVTAAADKPQHVSVRELPPLAVTGAPEEPKRTPRPDVPRAKPKPVTRPGKSRITFSRTANADTPQQMPPRQTKVPSFSNGRAATPSDPAKPASTPKPEDKQPVVPKSLSQTTADRPVAPLKLDDPIKPAPPAKPVAAAKPVVAPAPRKATPAPPPRARPYGDDTAASPRAAKPSTAPKRAVVAEAATKPTVVKTAEVAKAAKPPPKQAAKTPAPKKAAAKAKQPSKAPPKPPVVRKPAAKDADAKNVANEKAPAPVKKKSRKPAVKKTRKPAAKPAAEKKA